MKLSKEEFEKEAYKYALKTIDDETDSVYYFPSFYNDSKLVLLYIINYEYDEDSFLPFEFHSNIEGIDSIVAITYSLSRWKYFNIDKFKDELTDPEKWTNYELLIDRNTPAVVIADIIK